MFTCSHLAFFSAFLRQCSDGDCASATSGTITSPNYPLNYSVDQTDYTTLQAEEGKAIELTFTSMDIGECNSQWFDDYGHQSIVSGLTCGCDYVEILDSDESLLLVACGNEIPAPIRSTGNMMLILFHSDNSVTGKGFSANYKLVEPEERILTGEIKSPNYPENYPDNLNRQQYSIRVGIGKKVELTIEDLAIEYCDACDCDRLEIYDTPTVGSPTLLDVSRSS